MQTFECPCGLRLFFENSRCLACERDVGWCPVCRTLTALEPAADGDGVVCARAACGAALRRCHNYATHHVCNRCVQRGATPPGGTADQPLCDMCRFNAVIPDLSIAGNLEKWGRLEVAKRRVLHQFESLGLPPYEGLGLKPTLSFDFKADESPAAGGWRTMGREQVYTGQRDGKVTINIREADSVERERTRVLMGESQRTLVGHFRHELSHYLWDALIAAGPLQPAFNELFGNPVQPLYVDALETYHDSGPPEDWASQYISPYASMHPLEDWAETAATFLDICGVVETAHAHGHAPATPRDMSFDNLLRRFVPLSLFCNEINREIGISDIIVAAFTPPVRDKLGYAHRVLLGSTSPQ